MEATPHPALASYEIADSHPNQTFCPRRDGSKALTEIAGQPGTNFFFFFFNYLLSPKGRTYIFHMKTIYTKGRNNISTKGGENKDELETGASGKKIAQH